MREHILHPSVSPSHHNTSPESKTKCSGIDSTAWPARRLWAARQPEDRQGDVEREEAEERSHITTCTPRSCVGFPSAAVASRLPPVSDVKVKKEGALRAAPANGVHVPAGRPIALGPTGIAPKQADTSHVLELMFK